MNIKDCRGTIRDPIQFSDVSGVTAENISTQMREEAKFRGVPAKITVTTIHSGSFLFGNDYPCIMVSHPNPPQEYFDLLIILNGAVVSFMYWGNSKANYNYNKKRQLESEGKFSSIFVRDDPLALQAEHAWQADIMDLFDSLIRR